MYRDYDKSFGCVIARRNMGMRPSPSGLAKILIVKPISYNEMICPRQRECF